MKNTEMPIGFTMALSQNVDAMQKFALLSEEKKREIVAGTHGLKSREEMHKYVNQIRYL